jgi:hypothetical protein
MRPCVSPLVARWLLPRLALPMCRAIWARPVLGMTAAAIALGVRNTAAVPYCRRAYTRRTVSKSYGRMGLRSSANAGPISGIFGAHAGPAPSPSPCSGLHQAMSDMRLGVKGGCWKDRAGRR